MSSSLLSPKPADARRPASGSGRVTVLERRPAAPSRRRGVAGLVAVCVLALGVAACSAKAAKAEELGIPMLSETQFAQLLATGTI